MCPVQVGEFVEVSNDSETDPCAWLGVVSNKLGSNFEVSSAADKSADSACSWVGARPSCCSLLI